MRHRALLIGLSVLLVAVTIGSVLFTPSGAKNRFQPIPAHARLVYNNQNPDWFLSFFPSVFAEGSDATGMFGEILKPNAVGSNVWKKKFHCLETCPLTVATVALGGRERRDAWVAVSELGGANALALRWRLFLFPPAGVTSARSYAAWPIWKLEHPSIPVWARVRFSLTDGLLICSISDDSHDIYKLLDTLDKRAASLAERRGRGVE